MAASKFTPEVRGALIERTAAGVSLPDACRAVGVREGTVKGWITRGRSDESGEFAEFVAAIEAARQVARELPEAMTPDEFGRHLDRAVRAGSVQAMKLWADLHKPDDGEEVTPDDDPLAEVDSIVR